MAKVHCQHHQASNLEPVMIYFGDKGLGNQYICAVCSRVRVFNTGEIVSLSPTGQYGFISGAKENFFFHFTNLASDFVPKKLMRVSFEISFLEDNKVQAIEVRLLKGGNNGH